eukprot:CAMPEP_0206590622 /NCGR_PEP_ID=MMETSP0325_2-20121206/39745_1 /ASSEMBLY_ACC=CAM_ASM_000347 /TAXON_ID=2866 /ORGANISM="Crypthecodinium cohnii, Strain Seligo" /LENGTH=39 /DNA_ID= /DNA_START= /DNA_END= /DNA_ORIENTATION=
MSSVLDLYPDCSDHPTIAALLVPKSDVGKAIRGLNRWHP